MTTQIGWFDLGTVTQFDSMAYDVANKNIVAFGGFDNFSFGGDNQTWVLEPGGIWTRRWPQHVPPPRSGSMMAYCAGVGVVLFGGVLSTGAAVQNATNNGRFYGDTWVWDGQDWQQPYLFPGGGTSPSARFRGQVAYYPTSGMLLYGGQDSTSSSAGAKETWLLALRSNGVMWTLLSPTHNPGERVSAGMTRDSAGNIRIVGGQNLTGGGGPYHDSWSFNGMDWTSLGATGLPDNLGADAAYFTNIGKAVFLANNAFGSGTVSTFVEAVSSTGWLELSQFTDPRLRVDMPPGGAIPVEDSSGNITSWGETAALSFTTYQLRIIPPVHIDMHWATGGYPSEGS